MTPSVKPWGRQTAGQARGGKDASKHQLAAGNLGVCSFARLQVAKIEQGGTQNIPHSEGAVLCCAAGVGHNPGPGAHGEPPPARQVAGFALRRAKSRPGHGAGWHAGLFVCGGSKQQAKASLKALTAKQGRQAFLPSAGAVSQHEACANPMSVKGLAPAPHKVRGGPAPGCFNLPLPAQNAQSTQCPAPP
jgi:hypothetical protein